MSCRVVYRVNSKARVLFVDDEKRVLNSMRGLFRREYELFLTTDGASAVKIATENSIDVIVADQRMPGMSGTQVLGKVKELSPRTVRILLTGYADQSAVEGSINVGEVFRFLSKPCPPKELRQTLQLAIDAARSTPASPVPERPVAAAPIGVRPGRREVRTAAPAQPQSSPPAWPAERETPVLTARAVPGVNDSSTRLTPPAEPPPPPPPPPSIDSTSSHWQTVTEVILSGDTSTESQPVELSAHAAANIKDVGVVIFTVDSQFAEAAIRAVSTDRSTTLATTLSKVAQAVEQRDAGVLVTDFTTNSAMLQKMINALKQYLPELVTIVASGSRDTTDMINLINYGQVFRYVLKPIEAQSLRNDINAAAVRHMHLLNHPELIKRHRVRRHVGSADSSATMNRFVNRIQRLRGSQFDPTDSSV